MVQCCGVYSAHSRRLWQCLRQCFAQLDYRARDGTEQHVALEDDATGRDAQHGVSRHGQQCIQYRAVFRRGCELDLADRRTGNLGRVDAIVSVYGQVQVLTELAEGDS